MAETAPKIPPEIIQRPKFEVITGGKDKEPKKAVAGSIPPKRLGLKIGASIAGFFIGTTGVGVGLGEAEKLPDPLQEEYNQAFHKDRITYENDGTPVVEVTEATQVPETTAAPTTTETTVVSTTTETEIKESEFDYSMIKNRLHFPAGVQPEEEWFIESGLVPMWYVAEGGSKEGIQYMASGVVAGSFKEEIGESGEKELLLPVAFENPESGKFYIRNVSFGTDKYIQANDQTGRFNVIILNDYKYIGGENSPQITPLLSSEFFKNFKIGDQVAFSFMNEWEPKWGALSDYSEKMENDSNLKTRIEFIKEYFVNNKAVYESMKENKDLPDLKISPYDFLVNKVEE